MILQVLPIRQTLVNSTEGLSRGLQKLHEVLACARLQLRFLQEGVDHTWGSTGLSGGFTGASPFSRPPGSLEICCFCCQGTLHIYHIVVPLVDPIPYNMWIMDGQVAGVSQPIAIQ